MVAHVTGSHLPLIKVLVKISGGAKSQPELLIPRLRNDTPHRADELCVPTMVPTALLRDGFDNLGGGAPTLLAGLQGVSAAKFFCRMRKVAGAAINVWECLEVHEFIVASGGRRALWQ